MKYSMVYLSLLVAVMILAACGSSSDSVPTEVTPPQKQPDKVVKDAFDLPVAKSDNLFNISGNMVATPEYLQSGLVRNPAMGWVLYDDANDPVANASVYWNEMDKYAKYASVFYVRWRWSDLEPNEGEYVWKDKSSNFSRLIKGAQDRGLRLAFRIYYDSNGNCKQATPDYVLEAGAEGYRTEINGTENRWSPYADDEVFREKLSLFVKAFAEEFDDPSRVDFIDAFNLGWWGEGHDIYFKAGNDNEQALTDAVKWITTLYGEAFKRVPLVINYHAAIGEKNLDWVLENQGYQLRHDAFGSQYYWTFERGYADKYKTHRMIVAESCYWFVNTDYGSAMSGEYDFTEQWRSDETYNPRAKSWRDVYKRTYNEAAEARANMLDLREKREADSWTRQALDVVNDFIDNGGYRLAPVAVSFPQSVKVGQIYELGHSWKNGGFGVCPNFDKRWGGKYKVAIALLDGKGRVVQSSVDVAADPSAWLKESGEVKYKHKIKVDYPTAGRYYWAVGIVDTSMEERPAALNLAVQNVDFVDKWVVIGGVDVEK
ncbi:MAG: DUF4832 domain-containing protein [Alistipes sp.]|nr:DUF4832 domain-containing protein [Alistipes sp.]